MDNYLIEFKKKIDKRQARIAVVGLGYVGLPLALEFVKKGFLVWGVEIDKDRLSYIRKKESYITDVSNNELRRVLNTSHFKVSGDFSILKNTDIVIICVPTPLKRKYHPDISYIKQAVKSIGRNLKRGSLVILESTTYPGTTEEVILPLLEKNKLKHNQDFYLCFSPERIDPGNKAYPVNKIPKIVGGVSCEATELAAAVYCKIIDRVIKVSSSRVAEAIKLLENTFRLINIALVDELAMMAHKMKIDIWEVIQGAATKPFGFMPFYPGPGVGGHCIPKDPLYLYWKARHHGFKPRFIKLASDVISYMPYYIIERLEHALKAKGVFLSKARVLVVGVTYKKDIKDLRKSPSLDIIAALEDKGVKVAYHDPLVPYLKFNHTNLTSVPLKSEALSGFDAVVIATDHSSLNYRLILKSASLVFDTRNVFNRTNNRKVIRL
ncbi:MAG: nucleotide sugar dehydrogenase [Candidatus Omnitrophota bacterium]